MTLRHLQIFVEVVACGKMSAAANKLFISQSSVSQTISELEEYYNVRLFERLSRKLYITDSGRELLGYAQKILLLYHDMNDHMMHDLTEKIKIGATFTVAASVMSNIIQKFDSCQLDVQTEVVVERTGGLEQRLLNGDLDIALVEGQIESPDILVRPLLEDELFLVCSPDHPFFKLKKDTVPIEDLRDQPFVLREQGSKTRVLFEQHLIERDIPIREKWICNNSEAIKSAVVGGQGLAVMSERLIEDECRTGSLRKLRIDGIRMVRSFSLVYHKNKFLSDAMKKLIDICEEQVDPIKVGQ